VLFIYNTVFDHLFVTNIQAYPTMIPSPNDSKVLTRRVPVHDRSTVILSYTSRDASALRKLAASFTLKGDKKASLSLLSRRALQVYAQILTNPDHLANETKALDKMVTPIPSPAPFSTRKAPL
jgi:hypothetical protein